MSNIYIQEPVTSGKVLIHTTVGDIDVELWAKECPHTCRNFIQHCIDGFYDECDFHRVVPGFLVQTGDPNGDGGTAAFDPAELKDEFHSRLKFTRRGLLGMAKIDGRNGSQFFITLGPAAELDQKSTLFGKIAGNTVFNMMKLGEGEVNRQTERPDYVHKILNVEVLSNPFPELEPRPERRRIAPVRENADEKKCNFRPIKDYGLLSFADADDDEDESDFGGMRSAHDVGNDPRLLKEALDLTVMDDDDLLRKRKREDVKVREVEETATLDERELVRQEIKEICKELKQKEKKLESVALKRVAFGVKREVDGEVKKNPVVNPNEYKIQLQSDVKIKKQKEGIPRNKKERELAALSRMEEFKNKISRDVDSELYSHTFCVEEDEGLVAGIVDANVDDPSRYHISDPRNPINKRRRGEDG